MKKEIKFTETQKTIISQIQDEKKALQSEMQGKLTKILDRENMAIILICDMAGVKPVQGIELKEDSMLVPVEDVGEQDKKETKKPNKK